MIIKIQLSGDYGQFNCGTLKATTKDYLVVQKEGSVAVKKGSTTSEKNFDQYAKIPL